jgi:hypothetical protein
VRDHFEQGIAARGAALHRAWWDKFEGLPRGRWTGTSCSPCIEKPAKQLTRRQTERPLAGKEQYQQSAGGKRPQSNAGEGS